MTHQGPLYYNSDVVAELSNIELEELGKDRVRLTGVKGRPPPPTTKVGVTAQGGYQAEGHYYLCGLDIAEKAQMIEDQCRTVLNAKEFSLLKFMVTGTAAPNPASQGKPLVSYCGYSCTGSNGCCLCRRGYCGVPHLRSS